MDIPSYAYAIVSTDERTLATSTSGGLAAELSRLCLESGGVVYGCVMCGFEARHKRIDSCEQLPLLQGSKYVQSVVAKEIYRQIDEDLAADREVVFIGTPCQVAGVLKKVKGSEKDRLTTISLICHGVPSSKMLRAEMPQIAGGSKITFRRGDCYMLKAVTPDGGDVYKADIHHSAFLKGFAHGWTLRPSCHQCIFACPERAGDITIGDYWGLSHDNPLPFSDERGLSVALPTTAKGLDAIEKLRLNRRIVSQRRDVEEAVSGNAQLRHPVKITAASHTFSALFPLLSLKGAVRAASAVNRLLRNRKR